MVSLVEELKARYASRIIVFDLPPVLSADDAMAFSPLVDAVLLVVADGKTTRVQTERALEHLSDTHVLGTVLNQAREKSDDGDYY
jgi:Mrp family chromosome partitioning ATPase